MSLLDLSGKGALVLGGGAGIGRATAIALGSAGACTVVLDRHLDRAEAVASEISERGGESAALCAAVATESDIRSVMGEAEKRTGGLDIVVNILGSASWTSLLSMDAETWSSDLARNLDLQVLVGRNAARIWVEHGRPGVLCVVGSISGLFSAAGHAAYGAAKAGLLSFVRSAAEEWSPHGIRVNAVVPGSVRTPRIEAMLPPSGEFDESSEALARMAMPEDVANAILFLVSDLAARITGQSLVVDGGSTTRFPYRLV
ncbi:MAG: SDR family oxidoreductase [Deltaproteobacteria bacterium]|nr:SDR family oxidoreductase [Deltaproteobacteria bacterium]